MVTFATSTHAAGLTNQQFAYQYLLGKGLSQAQAAGVVGNLIVESNVDPTNVNPAEGALGIAQWEGARRTALEQFAASRGAAATDLQTQLDFLWQELHTSESQALGPLLSATTPGQAASVFAGLFERCAGCAQGGGSVPQRIADALGVFSGGVPAGTITNPGAGSTGVDTAGLLKASVVNVGPLFKINLGAVGNAFQMLLGFGLVIFGTNMVIKDLTGASPFGRTAEVAAGAVTGGARGAALAAAPRRARPAVRKVQATRRASARKKTPTSKRLDAATSKTVHEGPGRQRLMTGHKPRTEVGKRAAEFRKRGPYPAPRASERRRVTDEF